MNTTRFSQFAGLAAAALLTVSAQAATYSANPNLGIPDNNTTGITSTISVASTDLIDALTISVSLDHTFVGDLIVKLTHGATTVTLMDRPGSPATTFGDSTNLSSLYPLLFAMAASAPAESIGSGLCGTSNTVGATLDCMGTMFLPEQSLAGFYGMSVAGDWTLTVSDNGAADIGSLAGWTLNVAGHANPNPNPNPNPNTVPEPGSLALMAMCLGGLVVTRRRAA